MPAPTTSRQPGAPPAWFGSAQGRVLLAAERPLVAAALAARPAQPWLWLAPEPPDGADAGLPELPVRGLRLYRDGDGYAGQVRCTLPLPLPSECLGSIVLQHPCARDAAALLEECARVLMPGGRLWLLFLNPWSPYRLRWRRHGLVPCAGVAWRRRLTDAGLQADAPARHLGPIWRARETQTGAGHAWPLRAVCLLEAEKRTAALLPPMPMRRLRLRGAAPAARAAFFRTGAPPPAPPAPTGTR